MLLIGLFVHVNWNHNVIFCKLQKDPESKEVEVKRYTKGGYFGGMIDY